MRSFVVGRPSGCCVISMPSPKYGGARPSADPPDQAMPSTLSRADAFSPIRAHPFLPLSPCLLLLCLALLAFLSPPVLFMCLYFCLPIYPCISCVYCCPCVLSTLSASTKVRGTLPAELTAAGSGYRPTIRQPERRLSRMAAGKLQPSRHRGHGVDRRRRHLRGPHRIHTTRSDFLLIRAADLKCRVRAGAASVQAGPYQDSLEGIRPSGDATTPLGRRPGPH